MREQGVVVESDGGVATVAMAGARHEACKTCGVCRTSADGRQMLVDVHCENAHDVGETVLVEIPGPGQATSAMLLLAMPLILFLVGMGLGWALLPGRDFFAMLLGLCGMGIGWAIAALVDYRIRRSPEHQPRIVEE